MILQKTQHSIVKTKKDRFHPKNPPPQIRKRRRQRRLAVIVLVVLVLLVDALRHVQDDLQVVRDLLVRHHRRARVALFRFAPFRFEIRRRAPSGRVLHRGRLRRRLEHVLVDPLFDDRTALIRRLDALRVVANNLAPRRLIALRGALLRRHFRRCLILRRAWKNIKQSLPAPVVKERAESGDKHRRYGQLKLKP